MFWSDSYIVYRNAPCLNGTIVCGHVTLMMTQTTCYKVYSSRYECPCVHLCGSESGGVGWTQICSQDGDSGIPCDGRPRL